MKKPRWSRPTKEAGELDLPSRGQEQILTTNDEGHLLVQVVNGHGELIGPVATAVANQHVAALARGA